jgi:hypothetical protein
MLFIPSFLSRKSQAMSRARRSVSDADIQQYDVFRTKQKEEAETAGAGSFSFDDPVPGEGSSAEGAAEVDDEDLYG